MNPTMTRSGLPRIDAPHWFGHVGDVIASIGTAFFHRELIRLLEASIRSDAVWIIRYSGEAPPDVVYTHNVTPHAVKVYLEDCGGVDPFAMRWKAKREAGVFTLSTLRDDSVEYLLYTKLFLPAAGVEDELGIVFPVTGQNAFAFFLERERGRFTRAEVDRAKLMYPAIESLYRAHLGWLFNELRYTDRPEVTGLINRPTLIRDRSGQVVYSNDGWNDLALQHPSISSRVTAVGGAEEDEIAIGPLVVKDEALGPDFPLAPGGRMFVIERRPAANGIARLDGVLNVFQIFTPRERDILSLIMEGCDTAKISERLRIGLGSVKNCKMRIYRKADVATERALVNKFAPLYARAQP